ncbi:hypothetical protein GQ457_17G015440 [Hibiscus cannabinus]
MKVPIFHKDFKHLFIESSGLQISNILNYMLSLHLVRHYKKARELAKVPSDLACTRSPYYPSEEGRIRFKRCTTCLMVGLVERLSTVHPCREHILCLTSPQQHAGPRDDIETVCMNGERRIQSFLVRYQLKQHNSIAVDISLLRYTTGHSILWCNVSKCASYTSRCMGFRGTQKPR